jgi:hypothetical protein
MPGANPSVPSRARLDITFGPSRLCVPRCSEHDARWSSLVARRAHNPKVVGSNPTRATKNKGSGVGTSRALGTCAWYMVRGEPARSEHRVAGSVRWTRGGGLTVARPGDARARRAFRRPVRSSRITTPFRLHGSPQEYSDTRMQVNRPPAAADSRTIEAPWEKSANGKTWELDFDLKYVKTH